MKVKATDINSADLRKIKARNVDKCRSLYQSFPVATKIWIALKSKLPLDFISNNWDEITK